MASNSAAQLERIWNSFASPSLLCLSSTVAFSQQEGVELDQDWEEQWADATRIKSRTQNYLEIGGKLDIMKLIIAMIK